MEFANLFSKLSSTTEYSGRLGPPASTTRDWRGCKKRGGRQGFQPEHSQPNKRLKNDQGNQQDCGYRTSEGPKRGPANHGRGRRDNNFLMNIHMGQQNLQSNKADGPRRGQKKWRRGQRGSNFSAPARPRFMTQEFKDQNALVVDGQIICKHFIWGNCIKGNECQMLHAPVHNDLIKEMCKFYVVGFCFRGDSCPYMHKSFPCKFFHRKGLCVNGENCKFSHDPLTSVTQPLLDAESSERSLKVESNQETDLESASVKETEKKKPSDVLNPAMPKFYNSLEPCSEVDEVTKPAEYAEEKNITPQSWDSLGKFTARQEPVCYSVEAVLGPRHSYPALFSYSASHVPPSLPAAPSPPVRPTETSLSEASYSVSPVLHSYQSGGSLNPLSSSPVTKVCVPASSLAEVNSELSLDLLSKESFLKPTFRGHGTIYGASLTSKPAENLTPGAKLKTAVDVSRNKYPPQNYRSLTSNTTRLGDSCQPGLCGGFKSLFSSPPGQRTAPMKLPSTKKDSQDSPSSPYQRVGEFKDCVTFLVQNLKKIESACHQPDSQELETKRKRKAAEMASRCREFHFKSLFSDALPGASACTPEPAGSGDGDTVLPGASSLSALFSIPLSQMTRPPKVSPNSLHVPSSGVKVVQQTAGTHSRQAVETSAMKLQSEQDAEGRSKLQSNKRSQLKSLFMSLSPSSAFQ